MLNHRRRLHGGDCHHGQKVVGAMPASRLHRNFVMSVFWNSKMRQFLLLGIRCKPFAIKLNKLANNLHIMYRLLHSVISVGVYCFAFSLLTSQIQFFVHAASEYNRPIRSVTRMIIVMKWEKACENRILKQNRYVFGEWVSICKLTKVYKVQCKV